MFVRTKLFHTMIVTAASVLAATSALNVSADTKVKHVFELFTSQSCYSCPPAENLLGELIGENENLLGLEFHVDYWDSLVYGSAGKWRDPYSSAAYSKRQRDYSRLRLKGRKGVYTPQVVVDGKHAFVGSKKSAAKKHLDSDSSLKLDMTAVVSATGDLTINLDGAHDADADVWVIVYDRKHVTEVPSGENKGKTLSNFNVVRDMRSVGKWEGVPLEIKHDVGTLDDNQNCAVIVQPYDSRLKSVAGPIIGAAVCDMPG